MIDTRAILTFKVSKAMKFITKSISMRPKPMACSEKKRRRASTSEVTREISSPVFALL